MGIFGRALKAISALCGFGIPLPPSYSLPGIPPAANRRDRKHARLQQWRRRFMRNQLTHKQPRLTGARLARVQYQCSPAHLTVLSRGAFKTWAEGQI